jgi:hypothetical protein
MSVPAVSKKSTKKNVKTTSTNTSGSSVMSGWRL